LREAMKSLAPRKDVRVLLLTGEGELFCAGADLTAPKVGLNPDDPDESLRDYHLPMYQLLRELPFPTLAGLNGPAIGAGISLALCCDVVVAARSCYFQAAFVNIGLAPDTGASWVLHQSLGEAKARGMIMLGERISAEQAEQWGMIWKVVDDDRLSAEVAAIATKFATGPRVAYRHIRRLTREASRNSWRDHVLLEAESQSIVRASADAKEARLAFREKRKPAFTGE
jgi:2-(1,2-epoxy-1,2-dihydrophenyl)acetyl-CoA isomerase